MFINILSVTSLTVIESCQPTIAEGSHNTFRSHYPVASINLYLLQLDKQNKGLEKKKKNSRQDALLVYGPPPVLSSLQNPTWRK